MNLPEHPKGAHTVYLLHFSKPVQGKTHYIGLAQTARLDLRIAQHSRMAGARLTRQAVAQDAEIFLVRTWPNVDPDAERRLKTNGHFRRLCPLCREDFDPQARSEVRKLDTRKIEPANWRPYNQCV